jgi:hypothetical protein
LTTDSTGGILPEVRRAAEVDLQHPDDPDHPPGPHETRQMAGNPYSTREADSQRATLGRPNNAL